MTDAQRIASFLLKGSDPFIGYTNFHAPEVTYLCLHRTDWFTVKLYHIEPRHGWLVAPHSHRYAFTEHVLRGELLHYRFKELQGGELFTASAYDSPMLKGTGAWRSLYPCGLQTTSVDRLREGDAYTLDTHEVHTLEVQEEALLLVFQGPDSAEGITYLDPQQPIPNVTGFYERMGAKELYRWRDRLIDMLERPL